MSTYLADISTFIKNPALDIVVVLFFLIAGFVLGLMGGGRIKLHAMLFAGYVALVMSPQIFEFLSDYDLPMKQAYRNLSVFVLVYVVTWLILAKRVFGAMPRNAYRWWQALLMSFFSVGIFMSGALSVLSLKGIIVLSPLTKTLFANEHALLIWSLVPIVGLMVVSRSK